MTSGMPSCAARRWCSYQALFEGPSLSRTADSPGSRGRAPSSGRAGRSGKARRHAVPRGVHEGQPGGRAQVVLEHAQHARLVANHVQAGHADPDWRLRQLGHAGVVVVAALDHPTRDQPGRNDPLLAVDVGHEGLERQHALDQARLEGGPFVGAEHSRHRVDVERPVAAEGDAGRPAGGRDPLGQLGNAERLDAGEQRGGRAPPRRARSPRAGPQDRPFCEHRARPDRLLWTAGQRSPPAYRQPVEPRARLRCAPPRRRARPR